MKLMIYYQCVVQRNNLWLYNLQIYGQQSLAHTIRRLLKHYL